MRPENRYPRECVHYPEQRDGGNQLDVSVFGGPTIKDVLLTNQNTVGPDQTVRTVRAEGRYEW